MLIISLVATFLSVYDMSSSDRDILYDHKNTAKQLLYIREQYLILIADYKDSAVNTDELIKKEMNYSKSLPICITMLLLQLQKIIKRLKNR